MNVLINQMNDVLADWRSQFDILSAVSLRFSEDTLGQLCFNSKPICVVGELTMERAQFSADQITIYFEDRRLIQILMCWPEEEPPYAGAVILQVFIGQNRAV